MSDGKPTNSKKAVTIDDVAAHAGVSRALVSIVLRGVPGASDANRLKVMQAADELSYRPDQRARQLGRSRSRTIGITFGLHDENHCDLVEAFYQISAGTGFELILSPVAPTRAEGSATQALLDYRCGGLIMIGSGLAPRDLDSLAARVPVVVVARALANPRIDVVRTDDVAGARLAVEHLVQLGHRNIAHVHGGRIAGGTERRAGYRAAMRAAGLGAHVQLIGGGRTEDAGWAAANEMIANPPSAVFAYNDQCSVGLIARLREQGIDVPNDISVVGYDDSRLAQSQAFAMTTIAQDSRALAQHALDLVIGRDGATHHDGQDVVVPPRLVVRHTTAASRRRRG